MTNETAHFRRLSKKVPAIVGACVATVVMVGVALAVLANDKPRPAFGEALVEGLAVGVFAGGAIAAAVAAGFSVRMNPDRVLQGLLVAHAERLGMPGCIGFWLKRPASFSYGGRNWF